jgi:hypothetical protein
MDLFVGSNFVVRDLRPAIDVIRGKAYPYGWRGHGLAWSKAPRPLRWIEIHQTGGSLASGEEGPLTTARFVTANPWFRCPSCGRAWEGTVKYPHTACSRCKDDGGKPIAGHDLGRGRGWPKMCYHLFVPWRPLKDDGGRFIIYLCLDWNERSWHSNKDGNTWGSAIAFQGLFHSRHAPHFVPWPGTDGEPSPEQKAILRPLWYEYLRIELHLSSASGLKGHFQLGKPTCPGDYLEHEVLEIAQATGPLIVTPAIEPSAFPTWETRQQFLVDLGFDLGPYGPKKDGVDGKPGISTRAAIESLQEISQLPVTGIWDPDTERVAAALRPLPADVKHEIAGLLVPREISDDEAEAPKSNEPGRFGKRRRH